MKLWSRFLCMLLCISMAVGVLASCEVAIGGSDSDAYIEELDVNKKGELIVIFSDGEEENFGVFSPDGEDDGIVEISVSKKGKMTVKMANGKTKTVGYTYTEENEDDDEVIESVEINEEGELIVTRADGSEENLGRVRNGANVPPDPPADENDDIINSDKNVAIKYYDGDWKPLSDALVCGSDIQWEPGMVSITYLELWNDEDSALEFDLSLFVSSEVSGNSPSGNAVYLSEHLKYAFVLGMNGEKSPFPNRTTAYNVASEFAVGLNHGEEQIIMMQAHTVTYLALVVFMPDYVGNEANSGGTARVELSLAVTVRDNFCDHSDRDFNGSCDACGDTVDVGIGTVEGLEFYFYRDGYWEPITADEKLSLGVDYAWYPGGACVFYVKIHNSGLDARSVPLNCMLRENTPSQNTYGDKFYVTSALRYGILYNENPDDPSFYAPDEAIDRIKDRSFAANMQMMSTVSLSGNHDMYLAVIVYMPADTEDIYVSYDGQYDLYLNVGFTNDFSYEDTDFCREHADADRDHICDKCGVNMPPESCVHVDEYDDGYCDYCGALCAWWADIEYDITNITVELTHNSISGEFSPSSQRYLAGMDGKDEQIDSIVERRNEDAYEKTRVMVNYVYLDDVTQYSWGKAADHIYTSVMTGSASSPDIYCNFAHDLLLASLKGAFANLNSTTRGRNYISNSEAGYMSGIMSAYTLSEDKFYILASEYFVDIMRAAYVIPFNRSMAENLPYGWIYDYNGNGNSDSADLATEITSGSWTYSKIVEISGLAYRDINNNSTEDADDVLGFAIRGLAAGLVYSTSTGMVNREYGYGLVYNEDPVGFKNVISGISQMFSSDGVAYMRNNYDVRTKFANAQLLFGGIVYLADLERAEYQEMKSRDVSFSIVPVPTADFGEANPIFGTVATLGAISASTSKFTQCTAFLHFQSISSGDVMDTLVYYDYNYSVLDGHELGTATLHYIRQTISANPDLLVDEALFYYEDIPSWHSQLALKNFVINGADDFYAELYSAKAYSLSRLENAINALPE